MIARGAAAPAVLYALESWEADGIAAPGSAVVICAGDDAPSAECRERWPGLMVVQDDREHADGPVLDRGAAFLRGGFDGTRSTSTDGSLQPLSIRRIGWAGFVVTSERGTRVLVDPYLSGSDVAMHSGIPASDVPIDELVDVGRGR